MLASHANEIGRYIVAETFLNTGAVMAHTGLFIFLRVANDSVAPYSVLAQQI